MTERKLIKGVTINLGGEDYVVPPLNLEQLEQCAELFDDLVRPLPSLINDEETEADYYQRLAREGKDQVQKQRAALVTLAHAALSRNYPDLTLETMKQLIDLGNMAAITGAIMGASGLMSAGEPAPGE